MSSDSHMSLQFLRSVRADFHHMEARAPNIYQGLGADSFKRALSEWEAERSLLRSQLLAVWKDREAKSSLISMFEDECMAEIREAMITAAHEDVTKVAQTSPAPGPEDSFSSSHL